MLKTTTPQPRSRRDRKAAAKQHAVFDFGAQRLTADEVVKVLATQPRRIASLAGGGRNTLTSSRELFDGLTTTPLQTFIEPLGQDGDGTGNGDTVISALTGLEETLIVIAVYALVAGFATGYLMGKEDGLEEAAGTGEGGEGSGSHDDGGGQDGGDGEGA